MAADGLSIRSLTFGLAAPGANTDILSTALTPTYGAAWRVTVCLTTSSVFNMTITQGSTTFTCGINSSVALNAGDLYSFTLGVNPANSYNFQVETNSVIRILQIDEVINGAI